MESQPTLEQKKASRKRVWSWIIVILVFISFQLLSFFMIRDKNEELSIANKELIKKQKENTTCVFKTDSLLREVKVLSIYQTLSRAMVHRDQATKLLKYKVGDMVYTKRDSVKVVISDVLIGGSAYEYYVKYRILHKDNTTEDILPELVY